MQIETLQDVEMFIYTLEITSMLWHADDLVSDIPNFRHLDDSQRAQMQEAMNEAKQVCIDNECSIFDFYTLED